MSEYDKSRTRWKIFLLPEGTPPLNVYGDSLELTPNGDLILRETQGKDALLLIAAGQWTAVTRTNHSTGQSIVLDFV